MHGADTNYDKLPYWDGRRSTYGASTTPRSGVYCRLGSWIEQAPSSEACTLLHCLPGSRRGPSYPCRPLVNENPYCRGGGTRVDHAVRESPLHHQHQHQHKR